MKYLKPQINKSKPREVKRETLELIQWLGLKIRANIMKKNDPAVPFYMSFVPILQSNHRAGGCVTQQPLKDLESRNHS